MSYRKLTGVHTNRTDLPVLQRDSLIDAGTIGLFDFAHGWGFPEMASPVEGNKNLANYVRGGGPAVNGPTDKTWSAASGITIPNATTQRVLLPSAWVMPANATHFAVGLFAKIAVIGSGGNSRSAEIFGCRGLTLGRQYYFYLNITGAGLASVGLGMNNTTFTPLPVDAGYANDGAMHHYVLEFLTPTPTTWQFKFYIDGVLVYQSGTAAYSSFTQPDPGTLPAIGFYAPTAGTVSSAPVSVPRIWMQDLSVPGSKTLSAMIAQDRSENAARFL